MIAALALALGVVGAEPDLRAVCRDAPPDCRQAAADAILTWRTEARACERRLDGALERLSVRTSTVIRELVPVPSPAPTSGPSTVELVLGGGLAFVLGVVAGVLLAQ